MSDTTVPAAAGGPRGAGRPDPEVVDDPAQLTPAWFAAALAGEPDPPDVVGVTTESVGTGQMASTVRARLALAAGGERTVVVKFARPGVDSPMAAMAYAKEVAFYRELAGRVAVRVPRCAYAALADGTPRFTLVLEDMADARAGDQLAGCTADQAADALVNLAGLHAPTWCDADLATRPWLRSDPAVTAEVMGSVIGVAADQFAERFARELEPLELELLAACRELLARWMLDTGDVVAVLHGDYRLDNLLFPADGGPGVAAVDWQTASMGPPGRHLAFFLATCLEVEDRRRHEDDLVAAYHGALTAQGVEGYDLDACREGYRLGLLHAPLIVLLGRLTAGVTERGDAMFRAMWRRSATAIDDLAALDAVRRRLDG